MTTSRKLTIFEGCDGSGKSTAAKAFAQATGAKYVHFAALPRVSTGLARMYIEAMLPALLGYQDVVFDRCWISENPYGTVFRDGHDRLGDTSRRILERVALRCGAVLIECNPGWESVKQSYMSRRHLEMLDDVDQLKGVFDLYELTSSDLPIVHYDYTVAHGHLPYDTIELSRTDRHPLSVVSAGNWRAHTIIVSESIFERRNTDALYQWPFASFSKAGCSYWLAQQLDSIECNEMDLLWVDVNQDLSFLHDLVPEQIIALGGTAQRKLYELKIEAQVAAHPQFFKNYGGHSRYPLLDILQG